MRFGLAGTILAVPLAVGCGAMGPRGGGTSTPISAAAQAEQAAPAAPAPPSSPTEVRWQVRGLNLHADPVGALRVLLEIRHDGLEPMAEIQVTMRLSGPDGSEVGSRKVSPLMDVATPGQWIPVVASFAPGTEFADYRLEIRGQVAGASAARFHPAVETQNVSHAVGEFVALVVTGEVVNKGGKAAVNLRVVAACHDAEGRVVAVGSATPEASSLPPGGKSEFLLNLLDLAGEVATCQAYSQGMLSQVS